MLVLSRRVGDVIMVGHDVKVTVLAVGRDHVRIGIEAPREIEVHREEVYLEIQEANRRAAAAVSDDALAGLAGLASRVGDKRQGTEGDSSAQRPTGEGGGVPSPSSETSESGEAGRHGTATP